MQHLKKIFIIMSVIFRCTIYAQDSFNSSDTKLIFNVDDVDGWPKVRLPGISSNGNYVKYMIYSPSSKKADAVFQSSNNRWTVEIENIKGNPALTDNEIGVFLTQTDSLGLLTLGSSRISYIPEVKSYSVYGHLDNEFLIYQLKDDMQTLVIRNLKTGQEAVYDSVISFRMTEHAKDLFLVQIDSISITNRYSLKYVELMSGHESLIWRGSSFGNLVFDNAGSQICFLSENYSSEGHGKNLWYYRCGDDSVACLTNRFLAKQTENDHLVDEPVSFSIDGRYLYFRLYEKSNETKSLLTKNVEIWRWDDSKLVSHKLLEGPENNNYLAAYDLTTDSVIRVQYGDEVIMSPMENAADFVVINKTRGRAFYGEMNWNAAYDTVWQYIVFAKDGSRVQIQKVTADYPRPYISPQNKYVVYYNSKYKNYYCFNVNKRTTANITKNIKTVWDRIYDDHPRADKSHYPIDSWLVQDEGVFLYDQFDIWLIELRSNGQTHNLTNGLGKRNKIIFRILRTDSRQVFKAGDSIILYAFDPITKKNGFYSKVIGVPGDPKLLTMDDKVYFCSEPTALGVNPLKARNANGYLVRRESSIEYPNYFYTNDFKKFIQLSSINPHIKYKWLTSKIISWQTYDGRVSQGVLYLPDDFSTTKKYPVIFNVYERKSDDVNSFKYPDLAADDINIPYFVSRGYIVFTPDIEYIIGNPGESAFNYVVSAARHLCTFPWVNSKKIGIQGHSWGGYEVNYILTRTSLFAAAISASSLSNFVSAYGSLEPARGVGLQHFYEMDQCRMGKTLWEISDLYVKNSPIFHANKITTPLLMMSNKDDGVVPFSQGLELYTALRRLRRKVWLLQYPGEKHSLQSRESKRDYTIRMTEFFDHYLMSASPPGWLNK